MVWATHLCPGLCSPNQGKQMSGSHVTNHAALCSQGSLPRWLPGCFSPALSFKAGCWPGSPECLRAIVPGTWAAPLGPAPRVLAAAGRWVTAERAGLCSDLKSVLSSGRDCNIHRLCRAQRRAAPAQRLGGFASLYKLFFSEFPGDVELQLLSEQQQTGAAVITASESVLETPRGNAVSDWEQASFWQGGRPRSLCCSRSSPWLTGITRHRLLLSLGCPAGGGVMLCKWHLPQKGHQGHLQKLQG